MFSLKIFEIIENLNQDYYIKGGDIAAKLNITTRTLRNYIKKTNDLYGDKIIIESKHNKGYRLKIVDHEWYKKHKNSPKNDLKNFKLFQIYKCLFSNKMDILDICNELYISESLVFRQIRELKKFISKEYKEVQIVKNTKGEYHLIGNEIDIRCIYLKLGKLEQEDFINYDIDDFLYKNCKSHYKNLIEVLKRRTTLNDNQVKMFAVRLIPMIHGYILKRLNDNYDCEYITSIIKLMTKDDLKIVKKITDEINNNLVEINYEELYYIAANFLLYKRPSILEVKDYEFINNIVKNIEHEFKLSLILDKHFLENFMIHINSMLYRIIFKFNSYNHFISNIKLNYVFEYDIAIYISNKLEKYFKINIPEDEIGLIAIHIATSLIRTNKNDKKIFIISEDKTASRLLFMEIMKKNNSFINEVEIYGNEYDLINQINKGNIPFLVITDKFFKNQYPFCVILKTLENNKMFEEIYRIVRNSVQDINFNKLFNNMIEIKEDNISLAINNLATSLRDKQFAEKIIEREKKYSTYIGNGIMIPHEINITEYGNTKVIIGISQKGIEDFYGNKINLIIILSFSKSDFDLLKWFMKVLNEFKNDKDRILKFIKMKNTSILKKFIMEEFKWN